MRFKIWLAKGNIWTSIHTTTNFFGEHGDTNNMNDSQRLEKIR